MYTHINHKTEALFVSVSLVNSLMKIFYFTLAASNCD